MVAFSESSGLPGPALWFGEAPAGPSHPQEKPNLQALPRAGVQCLPTYPGRVQSPPTRPDSDYDLITGHLKTPRPPAVASPPERATTSPSPAEVPEEPLPHVVPFAVPQNQSRDLQAELDHYLGQQLQLQHDWERTSDVGHLSTDFERRYRAKLEESLDLVASNLARVRLSLKDGGRFVDPNTAGQLEPVNPGFQFCETSPVPGTLDAQGHRNEVATFKATGWRNSLRTPDSPL